MKNKLFFEKDDLRGDTLYALKKIDETCRIYLGDFMSADIIRNGSFFESLKSGNHRISVAKGENVQVLLTPNVHKFEMLWGTKNRFSLLLSDGAFSAGMNGIAEFSIKIPRKLYGEFLYNGNIKTFSELIPLIRVRLTSELEYLLNKYITNERYSSLKLLANKNNIANSIVLPLKHRMISLFGLGLRNFSISNILISPIKLSATKTKEMIFAENHDIETSEKNESNNEINQPHSTNGDKSVNQGEGLDADGGFEEIFEEGFDEGLME